MQNKTYSSKKTIIIVGHLVWDRIIKPDGGLTEAPGGIAYSLSALGVAADKYTRIMPVCNVGRDFYEKAKAAFTRYPAIDFSAVRVIQRENKIHELKYEAENYRVETNIGVMPRIGTSLLDKVDNIDIAYLNYIGGDEFPPSSIAWLKKKFKPLIYMDYHSLALGKKTISSDRIKRAKRFFRYNPHWREYISLADIVQMNEIELRSIFPSIRFKSDFMELAATEVHRTGPEIVIITREDKPVIIVTGKKGSPKILELPINPTKLVDPTGCGDCLGAGFITSFINDRDFLKACNKGLELAGKKAGFSGLDGFLDLM